MSLFVVGGLVLLIALTSTIEIRYTLAVLRWIEQGQGPKPAALYWRKSKRPLISLS